MAREPAPKKRSGVTPHLMWDRMRHLYVMRAKGRNPKCSAWLSKGRTLSDCKPTSEKPRSGWGGRGVLGVYIFEVSVVVVGGRWQSVGTD